MNNIILYGIGDARYQYRVLRYFTIYDERADTSEIKREFMESTKRNSIESCAIFKDTLEREGIKVF